MRCVFDTNVLVSALLLSDSKPQQALRLAFERGTVLLCFRVLAEIYDVLARKKFRAYVDERTIRHFLAALEQRAEWVEVSTKIQASRDPKDDRFLELALDGNATHLVTGDLDLLVLNPFRGIEVLPPHRFLELARR